MLRNKTILLLLGASGASVITFYSVKWIRNQVEKIRMSRLPIAQQFQRLKEQCGFETNSRLFIYNEMKLARSFPMPGDFPISTLLFPEYEFVILRLFFAVVAPVRLRCLFYTSEYFQAPKGVLLQGPNISHLIAKALANEANMRFLNLEADLLMNSISVELVWALFSLAVKNEPCIIFINEIDLFLRNRNRGDRKVIAMAKKQFMMLWDGLSNNSDSTVIVMGSTSRPEDLDKDIKKRMMQFHIEASMEPQLVDRLRQYKQKTESSIFFTK